MTLRCTGRQKCHGRTWINSAFRISFSDLGIQMHGLSEPGLRARGHFHSFSVQLNENHYR